MGRLGRWDIANILVIISHWVDGWINVCAGLMDGWIGWMDGWVNWMGWVDGWMGWVVIG